MAFQLTTENEKETDFSRLVDNNGRQQGAAYEVCVVYTHALGWVGEWV